MVRKQIRANANELIDDFDSVARGIGAVGASVLQSVGQQFCNVWQSTPQAYSDTPIGSIQEGFMNQLCNSREDQPDPPPIELPDDKDKVKVPFEGGQCEGDTYRFVFEYTRFHCFDEEQERREEEVGNVRGPVKEAGFKNDGESRVVAYLIGTAEDGGDDLATSAVESSNIYTISLSYSCSDTDRSILYDIEVRDVINFDNPDDDCGDLESPPPPSGPIWENPDDEPPQPDPINPTPPPNYPDGFPMPTIDITFNQENNTFEGDKFSIKLDAPDIVLEYDDIDPPDWIEPPERPIFDNFPCSNPLDLIPDGLRPEFPTPPDFLRDIFDRLTDLIPTPLPGVSVGDLLDAIEDEEDEEEEPIEIDVDRKSCEQGELQITTETIEVLPSQERVVREIIDSQNRIEEVRCSVGAFKGVRVEITEFPVRGKARFGDSPEQSKFFFGWLQFTREGEMFGAPQILEFNPQTFPFPLEADDFTIQFIDGAEGETEVIELEENGEV